MYFVEKNINFKKNETESKMESMDFKNHKSKVKL